MKRNILARRVASAALAACMMFTLSAPALAESTDALMQLSTGSYRSSSLLSEENSFPTTIKVNGKPVTEANISSILGSENTGKLSYDGVTNTLKSNGRIKGDLTIDAPGVNIELCNSTSGEAAVSGKLTVTNAQDVKVTAQSYVAVLGDVEISCDGKVEITSEESPTVAGDVTVKQASTVAISGESYGYHIVRGDVTIACPATVVIQNHGTGGMATKVRAGRAMLAAGIPMVVCEGRMPEALQRAVDGTVPGTLFAPAESASIHHEQARKLWIGLAGVSRGALIADDGACRALINRGASLLPVGVIDVHGDFNAGDIVSIYSRAGDLVARGICRFSSDEMRKIRGLRLDIISRFLSDRADSPAVHRDEMLVF